jgi:hypothetical protein
MVQSKFNLVLYGWSSGAHRWTHALSLPRMCSSLQQAGTGRTVPAENSGWPWASVAFTGAGAPPLSGKSHCKIVLPVPLRSVWYGQVLEYTRAGRLHCLPYGTRAFVIHVQLFTDDFWYSWILLPVIVAKSWHDNYGYFGLLVHLMRKEGEKTAHVALLRP